jgi:hypothetical protein
MFLRKRMIIHIKGESKEVFHRIVNVDYDCKVVECLRASGDPLDEPYIRVKFEEIDQVIQ